MKELYEKVKLYGEDKLTDLELINIILENNKESFYNYYLDIIMKKDRFSYIYETNYKELIENYKFTNKEAIKILALREIAKRINKPICEEKISIKTPKDVYDIFVDEFRYERFEKVKVLILNNKNIIKRIFEITDGKTDRVDIDPKLIVTEVLSTKYNKVILVHNHPSDVCEPSNEDINVTNHLKRVFDLFNIKFLDHIIIGRHNYRSII